MARPKGTKNIMRSPEEKKRIVRESYEAGLRKTIAKYGLSKALFLTWRKKYRESWIDGLKSQSGKHGEREPLRWSVEQEGQDLRGGTRAREPQA